MFHLIPSPSRIEPFKQRALRVWAMLRSRSPKTWGMVLIFTLSLVLFLQSINLHRRSGELDRREKVLQQMGRIFYKINDNNNKREVYLTEMAENLKQMAREMAENLKHMARLVHDERPVVLPPVEDEDVQQAHHQGAKEQPPVMLPSSEK